MPNLHALAADADQAARGWERLKHDPERLGVVGRGVTHWKRERLRQSPATLATLQARARSLIGGLRERALVAPIDTMSVGELLEMAEAVRLSIRMAMLLDVPDLRRRLEALPRTWSVVDSGHWVIPYVEARRWQFENRFSRRIEAARQALERFGRGPTSASPPPGDDARHTWVMLQWELVEALGDLERWAEAVAVVRGVFEDLARTGHTDPRTMEAARAMAASIRPAHRPREGWNAPSGEPNPGASPGPSPRSPRTGLDRSP